MSEFLDLLERHQRIALSFSGGKDSLACVYLLRPFLDLVTIYHNDTGDLLPEVMDIVEHVKSFAPKFVTVRGDVLAWQAENGLPADLLPHSSEQFGQLMGEGAGTRLVGRYTCCGANLIWPLYHRMKQDGITAIIRGTKTVDMKRLPAKSGDVIDGMELFLPLMSWDHAQVMEYLRAVGAPICRVYEHVVNAPECARCSAWWGEKRAEYLKQFHPDLFAEYRDRMQLVVAELQGPMGNLDYELEHMGA